MLSYAHGPSGIPLLGETIGACLDRTAASFENGNALISRHQGLRYTYGQLHAEVDRVARGLLSLGVDRGDRIGIWSANCAEWVIAQYASAKVGAILVNINPAFRLRELEYALQQSGVSVLVAARRFRTTDYVEMLVDLAPKLRSLRTIVYLGSGPAPGGLAWGDLLSRGDDVAASRLRERTRPAWLPRSRRSRALPSAPLALPSAPRALPSAPRALPPRPLPGR